MEGTLTDFRTELRNSLRFYLYKRVGLLRDGRPVPSRHRQVLEAVSRTVNAPRFVRNKYIQQDFLIRSRGQIHSNIQIQDGFYFARGLLTELVEEALVESENAISQYEVFVEDRSVLNSLPKEARRSFIAEVDKTEGAPLKHIPIAHRLTTDCAILRLASHPEILKVVTSHLGVFPILNSPRILYSPNDKFQGQSQLFHVDPEGQRQVKIFIMIRDIGEANSPLTFLRASATSSLRSRGGAFNKVRIPDEEILKYVPHKDWVQFTGKRSDLAFVDTSNCFHFGSRPGTAPRYMLYFHYLSPFSTAFPILGKRSALPLAPFVSKSKPRYQNYLLAGW